MAANTDLVLALDPARRSDPIPQLAACLRQGCVLCIEHAAATAPRYTRWQYWGAPCMYQGDLQDVIEGIDACRQTHPDHYVRLSVEHDLGRTRMSFLVHRPG